MTMVVLRSTGQSEEMNGRTMELQKMVGEVVEIAVEGGGPYDPYQQHKQSINSYNRETREIEFNWDEIITRKLGIP